MVARHFGMGASKTTQLEDQMFRTAESLGVNRMTMEGMEAVLGEYGVDDRISYTASWADIKAHLDSGKPCIVHGYFPTARKVYEHIVCITGYETDNTGKIIRWRINDPFGEYFASGYRNDLTGESVWFSAELFRLVFSHDGDIWLHCPSRR
jgi:Peptidase_C39 like family